jgi:hypothetical protein
VTTAGKMELTKIIGRRLRETPELSAQRPPSREIEQHLEALRHIEAQSDAAHGGRPTCEPTPSRYRVVD